MTTRSCSTFSFCFLPRFRAFCVLSSFSLLSFFCPCCDCFCFAFCLRFSFISFAFSSLSFFIIVSFVLPSFCFSFFRPWFLFPFRAFLLYPLQLSLSFAAQLLPLFLPAFLLASLHFFFASFLNLISYLGMNLHTNQKLISYHLLRSSRTSAQAPSQSLAHHAPASRCNDRSVVNLVCSQMIHPTRSPACIPHCSPVREHTARPGSLFIQDCPE